MTSRFTSGDTVQTPFGKGVVREVRNNGRLMVDVRGHAMVVKDSETSLFEAARKRSRTGSTSIERESDEARPKRVPRSVPAEIDLHGLTVEQALDRVQDVLNEALLADLGELRFIHGRGGGRLRAALHRRLRETSSVRRFGLDPRNEGVTIVSL
jgi:DNA mismatch repair protein MutS2